MTGSARVSVVVPTRNTRALTLACLESLRASRPAAPDEVIVVDDGSTDGTAAAVTGADVVVVRHDTPRGFSKAANAGFARATGELIWLLNSDTEVRPDALAALTAAFASDARLGVASAELWNPDGTPQWTGGPTPGPAWCFVQASGAAGWIGRIPRFGRRSPRGGRSVDWVAGAAMAIRRETVTTVGPFDESFVIYAQDLDFCLRARDLGWTVQVIGGCDVMHHRGATIEELPGATRRQHHGALWSDLVRWAGKRQGPTGAARIRRAIRAGASLRLLARAVAGVFVASGRRADWRAETDAIRAGRGAIGRAS